MIMRPHLMYRRRNGLIGLLGLVMIMAIFYQRAVIPTMDVASLTASICPTFTQEQLDQLQVLQQLNASHAAASASAAAAAAASAVSAAAAAAEATSHAAVIDAPLNVTNATVANATAPAEPPQLEPIVIMPMYPSIVVEDEADTQAPLDAHANITGPRPLHANSKLAIVTFLDDDMEQLGEDYYFTNTRMLTYQILHDEKTGIRPSRRANIDWVVAVGTLVSDSKRRQLEADGATVVEIPDLPGIEGLNTGDARWAHVMNKLRLFQWVYYDRVLFLDADMVLLGNVDDLFFTPDSVHPRRTNHARKARGHPDMPDEYVFIARPDLAYMGGFDHPYPDDPAATPLYFNAGFWLTAPDVKMFDYLYGLITMDERPFATNLPEQNLMNYAFRHCDYFSDELLNCRLGMPLGPMPWVKAESFWSSNRPSLNDYAVGVRSLHYKGWEAPDTHPLRSLWVSVRAQMLAKMGVWPPVDKGAVGGDATHAEASVGGSPEEDADPSAAEDAPVPPAVPAPAAPPAEAAPAAAPPAEAAPAAPAAATPPAAAAAAEDVLAASAAAASEPTTHQSTHLTPLQEAVGMGQEFSTTASEAVLPESVAAPPPAQHKPELKVEHEPPVFEVARADNSTAAR